MKEISQVLFMKLIKKSVGEKLLSICLMILVQVSLLGLSSSFFKYFNGTLKDEYFSLFGLLIGLAAIFLIPKKEILFFFENKKIPLKTYIRYFYVLITSLITLPLFISICPYHFSIIGIICYSFGIICTYNFYQLYLLKDLKKLQLFISILLPVLFILACFFSFDLLMSSSLLLGFAAIFSPKIAVNHNKLYFILKNDFKISKQTKSSFFWKPNNILFDKEIKLLLLFPIYMWIALLGFLFLFGLSIILGNSSAIVLEIITILLIIMLNDTLTLNSIGIEKKQFIWFMLENVPVKRLYTYKMRFYGGICVFVPSIIYFILSIYFSYFSISNLLCMFIFAGLHFLIVFYFALNTSVVSNEFYKVPKKIVYLEMFISIVCTLFYFSLKNTLFYYVLFIVLLVKIYYRINKDWGVN